MQKLSRLAIAIVLFGSLLLPASALAQNDPADSSVFPSGTVSAHGTANGSQQLTNANGAPAFQPLTDVSGTPFANLFSDTSGNLQGFFETLFKTAITIGALLAVLMIAWSGYQYMLTDVVTVKGDARKRIQNALLGLLMLLATVLILNQINPQITSLSLLTGQQSATNAGTGTGPSGVAADPGTTTSYPNGYCAAQAGSGVSYRCFNTMAGCQQINGAEGACTSYSVSESATQQNGTYCAQPQGSGYACFDTKAECDAVYDAAACQETADVVAGSSYDEYRWTDVGKDSNGNVGSCTAMLGTGWVTTDASFCSATDAAGGTHECCGLSAAAASAPITSATDRRAYTGPTEQQYMPDGAWCYSETSGGINTAYCSLDQTTCSQQYTANYVAGGQFSGCALHGTSHAVTAGEVQYSDINNVPNGDFCYRANDIAFCSTNEQSCTANQGAYAAKNPSASIKECAEFDVQVGSGS